MPDIPAARPLCTVAQAQQYRIATREGLQIQYSTAEKLAALRQAQAIHNHPQGRLGVATYRRIQRDHPEWPVVATYLMAEGWNWWLTKAKIPTSPRPQQLGLPHFSEEQYRKATKRIGNLAGGSYSMPTYEALRRKTGSPKQREPSAGAIRARFGAPNHSWIRALQHLAPQLFTDEVTQAA